MYPKPTVRFEAGRHRAARSSACDDDKYIYVDLDFDSIEAASAFKTFLENVVWASPDNSPGLGGTPRARVLTEVETKCDCRTYLRIAPARDAPAPLVTGTCCAG